VIPAVRAVVRMERAHRIPLQLVSPRGESWEHRPEATRAAAVSWRCGKDCRTKIVMRDQARELHEFTRAKAAERVVVNRYPAAYPLVTVRQITCVPRLAKDLVGHHSSLSIRGGEEDSLRAY